MQFLLTRFDSEAECPSRDGLRPASAPLASFFGCWVEGPRSATNSGVLSVWSTAPTLPGDSFRGPARVMPASFMDYNRNDNGPLTTIQLSSTYIAATERYAKLKKTVPDKNDIVKG